MLLPNEKLKKNVVMCAVDFINEYTIGVMYVDQSITVLNYINGETVYQKEGIEGDFRMYDITYFNKKLIFSSEKNLYAVEIDMGD